MIAAFEAQFSTCCQDSNWQGLAFKVLKVDDSPKSSLCYVCILESFSPNGRSPFRPTLRQSYSLRYFSAQCKIYCILLSQRQLNNAITPSAQKHACLSPGELLLFKYTLYLYSKRKRCVYAPMVGLGWPTMCKIGRVNGPIVAGVIGSAGRNIHLS